MWEKAMKWLHVVVLFIILNFLWLAGTAVGIIVFGVIPSTVAILKLIELPRIFENNYGYGELILCYIHYYKEAFKHSKILLFVPIVIEIIAFFELLMISRFEFLQAIFQIPMIILMVYNLLIVFHICCLALKINTLTLKNYKLVLLSPLIFKCSTLFIIVTLVGLAIITIFKSWMFSLLFSTGIYVAYRLINHDYENCGWLK